MSHTTTTAQHWTDLAACFEGRAESDRAAEDKAGILAVQLMQGERRVRADKFAVRRNNGIGAGECTGVRG